MTDNNQRGPVLLTITPPNPTQRATSVKAADLICWRSLDGRSCIAPGSQASFDVVVIPIPASKPPSVGGQSSTDVNQPQPAALATDAWSALVQQCQDLAEDLAQATGLRTHVDASTKQSPGAKYHRWEAAGVPLRIEIGQRELATNTACIVFHPAWPHAFSAHTPTPHTSNPPTTCAAQARDADQTAQVTEATDQPGVQPQQRRISRPVKLPGLTHTQLIDTCRHAASVLSTQRDAGTGPGQVHTDSKDGTQDGSVGACPGFCGAQCALVQASDLVTHERGQSHRQHSKVADRGREGSNGVPQRVQDSGVHVGVCPDPRCLKLHLWLGCNSVAALWSDAGLGRLVGLPRPHTAGTPNTTHSSSPPQPSQTVTQTTRAHATDTECKAGSAGVERAAGDSSAAQQTGVPQRVVCAAHVRHLLGIGPVCHCDIGHVTLCDVRGEVERCVREEGRGQLTGWTHTQPTSLTPQNKGGDSTVRESTTTLAISCLPTDVSASVLQTLIRNAVKPVADVRVRVGRGSGGRSLGWGRMSVLTSLAHTVIQQFDGNTIQLPTHEHTSTAPESPLAGQEQSGPSSPHRLDQHQHSRLQQEQVAPDSLHNSDQPQQKSHGQQHQHQQNGDDNTVAQASLATPTPGQASLQAVGPRVFTLHVSASCGRTDALFADVPDAAVRARLRVDATAAYSVTDAATAARMADLTLCVLGALNTDVPRAGAPGGLTFVDGTACAGGNTIALVRALSTTTSTPQPHHTATPTHPHSHKPKTNDHTHQHHTPQHTVWSVELHPDRAADLPHNLRLLGLVPLPGSSETVFGDSKAVSARVLCGDYTALWSHIPACDCVMLDPPWGGPQYNRRPQQMQQQGATTVTVPATTTAKAPTTTATHTTSNTTDVMGTYGEDSADEDTHSIPSDDGDSVSGGVGNGDRDASIHGGEVANGSTGTASAAPSTAHAACACSAGAAGCALGDTPLCALCAALLGSGHAFMVALKLPHTGRMTDHDDFAACVAKRMRDTCVSNQPAASARADDNAVLPACTAGAGDSLAPAGRNAAWPTAVRAVWACKVVFGRTCLVVLVALPHTRQDTQSSDSSKGQTEGTESGVCQAGGWVSGLQSDGSGEQCESVSVEARLKSAVRVWAVRESVPVRFIGVFRVAG